jgi:EmrB/QacA subfamily drug resistance transporter
MENLDGTVIVTALPQIAQSFGAQAVDLNISVSAYMLTIAVFIPITGWVVDRFGPRNVFAAAVAVFTGASVLCGLSPDEWSFTACRVLQGIGGAMMMPVGRLVMLRSTQKHDLARAITYIVWPGLAAPVLGPPVGGFITTYFGWRWIFFLNVPLGLIGIALALLLIDRGHAATRQRFDLSGFLLCGGVCGCLTYGLELLARVPTPWPQTTAFLGTGLVLGLLTIRHLRRAKTPLIDLGVLSIRTYMVTLRGGSLFRLSVTAVPFLLPLMFQLGFGLDAFTSGLLVLAVFAGSLFMKVASTQMLRRYGFRRLLLVNGGLTALTISACAMLVPSTPYAAVVVVLFAGGLARSLQFTALNALSFADVTEAQTNAANTLAGVAQQLSLGLGITGGAIALRLAGLLHHGVSSGPTVADFHVAFMLVALMTAISTLDALTLPENAGAVVSGHRVPAR